MEVEYLDAGARDVIPTEAVLERIAGGFGQLEGPAWNDGGFLVFSDMAQHLVYRWTPGRGLTVHLEQPGWTDALPRGPNGLAFDVEGRLLVCQHGERTVVRLESDGRLAVLADRYDGKRLNSPNDLAIRSDGRVYFTDPPVGLKGGHEDARRELRFSGVYSLFENELSLVHRELTAPNGIAFSPDEKYLYVSNSDAQSPIVVRFEVEAGGNLTDYRLLFDFSRFDVADSLDGLKTDGYGNIYVTSSSGIHVLSPAGRHLAIVRLPEAPSNLAWGDSEQRSLYITAQTTLFRLSL